MALEIPCPTCGWRPHTEFVVDPDATTEPPPAGLSDAAEFDRVWNATNARGPVRELWWHELGCRQWLVVARDSQTNEVSVDA